MAEHEQSRDGLLPNLAGDRERAVRRLKADLATLRDANARLAEQNAGLVAALGIVLAQLKNACDGMWHDEPNCPQDDTCTCRNVAAVNACFAADFSQRAAEVMARVEAALESATKWHLDTCDSQKIAGYECSCQVDQARAALAELHELTGTK